MASRTPGDGLVDSRTGAIEGQQESIAPASGSLADDQTLGDADQTGSDSNPIGFAALAPGDGAAEGVQRIAADFPAGRRC